MDLKAGHHALHRAIGIKDQSSTVRKSNNHRFTKPNSSHITIRSGAGLGTGSCR